MPQEGTALYSVLENIYRYSYYFIYLQISQRRIYGGRVFLEIPKVGMTVNCVSFLAM